MRRGLIAVLMMLLCLLCACNSKETDNLQAPMDFRAALLQAQGCSFTAQVTADYDDRVYEFTLSCIYKADGTAELKVMEPESIEGISAQVTEQGGQLIYDGMAVDFGPLAAGELSPVSAPLALADAWAGEYISACGTEKDSLRVTYTSGFGEAQLTVDTWFDENNAPILGEICYNDKTVLRMTISDFSFAYGGANETTKENLG